MNVRRIKRKCDVRGCKNTDVFSLSNVREHGRTVIMCRQCIEDAYNAVKNYKENDAPKKQGLSSPPPLFYHPDVTKNVPEQKKEVTTKKEPIKKSVDESDIDTDKKNKTKINT